MLCVIDLIQFRLATTKLDWWDFRWRSMLAPNTWRGFSLRVWPQSLSSFWFSATNRFMMLYILIGVSSHRFVIITTERLRATWGSEIITFFGLLNSQARPRGLIRACLYLITIFIEWRGNLRLFPFDFALILSLRTCKSHFRFRAHKDRLRYRI